MNRTKKDIAVVFGGKSCEHEVSLLTAVYVLNALSGDDDFCERFNVYPVYSDGDDRFFYSERFFDIEAAREIDVCKKTAVPLCLIPPDNAFYRLSVGGLRGRNSVKAKPFFKPFCVLDLCHGGSGEGGAYSALFELCGIPITCADATPSGIFMSKSMTKTVARGASIPVLPWVTLRNEGNKSVEDMAVCASQSLGFPLVVKPDRLGSSIGVFAVNDAESLPAALSSAFRYDETLILEKRLRGFTEANCAAFRRDGEIVLSEIEIPEKTDEIFGFEDKYLVRGAGKIGGKGAMDLRGKYGLRRVTKERERIEKRGGEEGGGLKSAVTADEARRVKGIMSRVFDVFGLSGCVRADFFIKDGEVVLNEVNTVPGNLASHLFDGTASLADIVSEGGRADKKERVNLPELVGAMIDDAAARSRRRSEKIGVVRGNIFR